MSFKFDGKNILGLTRSLPHEVCRSPTFKPFFSENTETRTELNPGR